MPLEPASRDTCMVPAPGLGWDTLPANATCVIASVASENQKELCGRQALCQPPKCALGTSRVPIWRVAGLGRHAQRLRLQKAHRSVPITLWSCCAARLLLLMTSSCVQQDGCRDDK